MEIGVLALQGAFREHVRILEKLDVRAREVRLPADLVGLSGLILPGGESTTMSHLMSEYGLWEPVRALHAGGAALWGTCAGAILLAREVRGGSAHLGEQPSLGLLDVTVQRNAFGRQLDSFTTALTVQGLASAFPAVFIRAPVFSGVGAGVEVLSRLDDRPVLVRQGRVWGASFHPELSGDLRLHQKFKALCAESG